MTAPLPLQPAPVEQPPRELTPAEQEAVAALTTFLAEAAVVTTVALPPYLYSKLIHLGFNRRAIRAATRIALSQPVGRRPGARVSNTAVAHTRAGEPELRALYLLNAARRITQALVKPKPAAPGQPAPSRTETFVDAVQRERRYFDAHREAQRRRREAAQAVDDAAQAGPWLQWITQNDARVEADCRALAGQLFTVDDPPMLHGRPAFPGAAHGQCRCYARPFGATRLGRQATVTATR